jgi:hypothetical protein
VVGRTVPTLTHFWHLLSAPECRRAVEVAERFADGEATLEEQAEAGKTAHRVHRQLQPKGTFDLAGRAAGAAASSAERHARTAAWSVASAWEDVLRNGYKPWNGGTFQSPRACNLLRDLAPVPPGAAVSPPLPAAVLAWSKGTVVRVAQGIYENRDFATLPVLADALEEAGCADARVVGHCRSPGPHVRGCWVVDLILSKDG